MSSSPDERPSRPEVAEGMAAARQRGVRLGRPPAPVPPSAQRAADLRASGLSLAQIAEQLNAEGVATPSGSGEWSRSRVQGVLKRFDEDRQ